MGKERTFRELSKLLKAGNALLIGELITRAATMRKETRGAHNRDDYPDLDEAAWSKNIVFHLPDDKMIVTMKTLTSSDR